MLRFPRIGRAGPAAAALLLALAACDRDPTGAAPSSAPGAPRAAEAAAWNGRIRVGVVQSAGSVTIGSAADYTIRDRVTGAVLLTGTNGTATVTLASVVQSWYRLQVMCGSTAAVAARKAAAEAAGVPTFTEFVATANCTRLFLGRFPANASFSVRNTYRNGLIAQGLSGTDSFWAVKADPGVTAYRVTRGATVVDASNPVVLTSSDGIVTINGARYRSEAEVRINGAGTLAGINELPMEEYLYGVVPRELGPVAYPELEALKAQAVAARTYGMIGLGKRASDGYDMRATTDDQVYGGYAAEHPLSSRAVDETRGVVATHGGRLITALYSSTSGGHSADNEEAFNSAPTAYLRGAPLDDHGKGKWHEPTLQRFKADARVPLRTVHRGDLEADWARFYRWSFEWTAEEISEVISAWAGQPVGQVKEINVLERGPSGRVLRIEYVTEAGTFTHTRDAIRSSLRYIDASGRPTNLLSTLFFVEPVVDKRRNEDVVTGFVVYGGGFGHGVGMSQTGAVGMAEEGATFDQILKHFYTGIELETRY